MSLLPRASALVALALLALPLAPAATPDSSPLDACGDRPIHPPIEISERYRMGYAARDPTGSVTAYAPGVLGGSGTEEDPYRIEGWCIVRPRTVTLDWGVRIHGSDSHAVVRDVVVVPNALRGVYLQDSSNVTVERSTFVSNHHGILVEGGRDHVLQENAIVNNRYAGVIVDHSDRVEVLRNRIEGTGGESGIDLSRAANAEVSDNVVTGFRDGIRVWFSSGARVRSNEVTDNRGAGIASDWAIDALFEGNVVANNAVGVRDDDGRGSSYRGNRVENNAGHGFAHRWYYEEPEVVDNVVRANGGSGLWFGGGHAGPAIVRGNNVEANLDGGLVAHGDRVDARENWWGCAGGPSDPACDRVVGDRVTYEPWLTQPNPDAGGAE